MIVAISIKGEYNVVLTTTDNLQEQTIAYELFPKIDYTYGTS